MSSAAPRPAPAKPPPSPCPFCPSWATTAHDSRVLVLEPTRELAAQVETAIHDLARFTKLHTAVLYGGVGYGKQMDANCSGGADVIIATPGRLLDHMERGTCRLGYDQIPGAGRGRPHAGHGLPARRPAHRAKNARAQRHTSLFSATIPPQIATLIQWAMKDPQTVEIGARRTPAETVEHVIYPVAEDQKTDLLLQLLKRINADSVIIFCRTKHGADRVANLLKRNQHAVAVLHSNRTQREREDALRGFREGKYRCWSPPTSPRAAWTLPTSATSFNYDVPQHPEDYIHRIGRTGRAEHSGDALTLMIAADATHVFAIERFINQKIPRVKLDNFDYKYTALFEENKPGQKPSFPGKVRGGRIRGGYTFSPGRR